VTAAGLKPISSQALCSTPERPPAATSATCASSSVATTEASVELADLDLAAKAYWAVGRATEGLERQRIVGKALETVVWEGCTSRSRLYKGAGQSSAERWATDHRKASAVHMSAARNAVAVPAKGKQTAGRCRRRHRGGSQTDAPGYLSAR
jgi:hypothetical protein